MKFSLNKAKSGQILKDKISIAFGFGSQKNRLDYKINHYKEDEIHYSNQEIAFRQITISDIQNKLRELKNVMDSYDKFLEYYDNVLSIAEQNITRSDSEIKFKLVKPDNEILAIGNYRALDIEAHLKKNASIISFLTAQLERIISIGTEIVASKAIQEKGYILFAKRKVELVEVYHQFYLAKQMLNLGEINSINTDINSFEELKELRNIILSKKRNLILLYDELSTKLSQLQRLTDNNQRKLKEIEEIKQILKSSEEYTKAKASHDYLEQITRK